MLKRSREREDLTSSTNSSRTISSITHRSRTLLLTRQAYENSTGIFALHSPTFMLRPTGNLPTVTGHNGQDVPRHSRRGLPGRRSNSPKNPVRERPVRFPNRYPPERAPPYTPAPHDDAVCPSRRKSLEYS